jgi:N-acetylmuramic acid 6-phosphate (MurNAc-6-P) etherase
MVDVAATNAKLVDRAIRIYRAFHPDESRETAHATILAAGGRLKVAIAMRARAVGRDDAEALLAAAEGSLRRVIG